MRGCALVAATVLTLCTATGDEVAGMALDTGRVRPEEELRRRGEVPRLDCSCCRARSHLPRASAAASMLVAAGAADQRRDGGEDMGRGGGGASFDWRV